MTQFSSSVSAASSSLEKDMNMLQEINQHYKELKTSIFASQPAMKYIVNCLSQYSKNEISTSKLFGYRRTNEQKTHDYQWTEEESRKFRQDVVKIYQKLDQMIKDDDWKSLREESVSLCESLPFCRNFICSLAESMKESNKIQKRLANYLNAIQNLLYEKRFLLDKNINYMMIQADLPDSMAWQLEEWAELGFVKAIEKYDPTKAYNSQIGKTASFNSFAAYEIRDAIRQKLKSIHPYRHWISLDDDEKKESQHLRTSLRDNAMRPDEYLEKKETSQNFSEDAILDNKALKNKDKLVILLHLGFIPKNKYSVADICNRLDISVDIRDICFDDENDNSFTFDEIGDILHVSKQSVQQRMKQSIKALSEYYGRYYC
ncbi:MAG: hypothetical protein IJU23_04005 [Proteobacteria bacterium]|nr:hypothetical protein [Pseudomonadota bacterium]